MLGINQNLGQVFSVGGFKVVFFGGHYGMTCHEFSGTEGPRYPKQTISFISKLVVLQASSKEQNLSTKNISAIFHTYIVGGFNHFEKC